MGPHRSRDAGGRLRERGGLIRRARAVRVFEVSAALIVIELALSLSGRGTLPLPTGVSVSVLAIPAILGGIVGGPVAGALVGGAFGLTSYALATTPLFHNAVIAIGPRLLIGAVAVLAYQAARPIGRGAALALAGALGAITNTGLILLLATVLTGPIGAPYLSPAVAWDVARTSIWYEVIVAAIVVTALGLIWNALQRRPAIQRKR